RQLRCGRVLDKFPDIIGRLAEMVERFATTLDCVDTTFIGDQLLDQLPLPTQIGQTRVGGVDLNKSRIRAALSATLALSVAPSGFIVAEFTTKVHTMTGQTDSDYTSRQAAYDLRKLRGKPLVVKPDRTRRYQTPTHTATMIAAILTLRDQVISPILAGVRSPRLGGKPATWTAIDRDYERLRIDMHTLFKRPRHYHHRSRHSIDNFCRSPFLKRLAGDVMFAVITPDGRLVMRAAVDRQATPSGVLPGATVGRCARRGRPPRRRG
ncbi:MAG: hypothetical protein ACRDSH_22980, partial [Pseudonocardiaceae bacterium]